MNMPGNNDVSLLQHAGSIIRKYRRSAFLLGLILYGVFAFGIAATAVLPQLHASLGARHSFLSHKMLGLVRGL
jgi:hypothetical protein